MSVATGANIALHTAGGIGGALLALPVGAIAGAGIGGVANMHADRKAERRNRKHHGSDSTATTAAPAVMSHHYIAQCTAIGAAGLPLAALGTAGISGTVFHRKIRAAERKFKSETEAALKAHDDPESSAEARVRPSKPTIIKGFEEIANHLAGFASRGR